MARLKSIQVKFHPIELTLRQENVHVRLSYSWGPQRELFQDCFQGSSTLGLGTFNHPSPQQVSLNYSFLSYTQVQVIFRRTNLSLKI